MSMKTVCEQGEHAGASEIWRPVALRRPLGAMGSVFGLWLAVAGMGLLTGAGCTPVATNADADLDAPAGDVVPSGAFELGVAVEGGGEVERTDTGTLVTLLAVPNPGWAFAGWTGIGTSANPVTIVLDRDMVVSAVFVPADEDDDGVADGIDACDGTVPGDVVDAAGCGAAQRDSDADGVTDDLDACAGTELVAEVDASGCAATQRDSDGDSVNDALDECPGTGLGAGVDERGCAAHQRDSDGDGVTDDLDLCADSAAGEAVGADGCPAEPEPDYSAVCGVGKGCGTAQDSPGCADEECCTSVCDLVPACCETAWTAACVAFAVSHCGIDADVGGSDGEDDEPPGGGGTPVATCGNGLVEPGEACDDGNAFFGDGCTPSCQAEAPPDAPPDAGDTVWYPDEPMFYFGRDGPEWYDLADDGVMTQAYVTPDLDLYSEIGTITSVVNDVPLGVDVQVIRVDDLAGYEGEYYTAHLEIDEFQLTISGSTATWSFDMVQGHYVDLGPLNSSALEDFYLTGYQTGTVSADGSRIEWYSVSGTMTICYEEDHVPTGCDSSALIAPLTSGWTRSP